MEVFLSKDLIDEDTSKAVEKEILTVEEKMQTLLQKSLDNEKRY